MSMMQRIAKILRVVTTAGVSLLTKNKFLQAAPSDAQQTSSEKNWQSYYERTHHFTQVEPHYLRIIDELIKENPKKELKALDLGTGTGVVALLMASIPKPQENECAFRVIAEDMNRNALEIIEERAKEQGLERCIRTRQRDISKESGPSDEQFDLVIARVVMPFVQKGRSMAEVVKSNITDKLTPGGATVVEFFGMKHPWCHRTQCHTIEEIKGFFSEYKKVEIIESAKPVKLVGGGESPWDEITVIARK